MHRSMRSGSLPAASCSLTARPSWFLVVAGRLRPRLFACRAAWARRACVGDGGVVGAEGCSSTSKLTKVNT